MSFPFFAFYRFAERLGFA